MNKKIRLLRKYFDGGEKLNCGDCNECCTAIMMTKDEKKRIMSYMKKKGLEVNDVDPEKCEYLGKDGKCMVYEERPIICRAFGKMQEIRGMPPFRCTFNPGKNTLWIPEEMIWYRKLCTVVNKAGKLFLSREKGK